ncbi:hypothetical protein ACGFS9_30030 [Streptomyces sp. NPDC048566]|uniref:hypothetical protein n=1 Tax=Streptomyces sp. NPDC048566 TaxID=3365569 RepID=UPI003713A822
MQSQVIPHGYVTAHQTARHLGLTLDGARQLVRRGRPKRSGGTPDQPRYAGPDAAARQTSKAT